MTAGDAAVRVRGLVKRYADTVAVDGLDLEIWRGETFALLGPVGPVITNPVDVNVTNAIVADPVTSELAMFERVNASRTIPTAPVQADRVSVDFDYQLVTVTRPWWCAPLLELNGDYDRGSGRAGRARLPAGRLAVRDAPRPAAG
jgi:hypothetical protein